MARDDISWVRLDAEGNKLTVYAHQIRERWDFYCRARRHDDWEALLEPTVEDWHEVLDGVRRRTQRRQYAPDVADNLAATLRKRYPQAGF
jgi:hypothetical protein